MLQPEDVLISELLQGMHELLVRAAGDSTVVDVLSAEDVWHCRVDPTQLESAILNLVLNARDALPAGLGSITIRCVNETSDDAHAQGSGFFRGDFVRIDVADTGSGIAPELLAKVFEPFFTTKEVGKGSGLGLAQVHGFVGQSGGWVDIESEIGQGTTVSLFLPRVTVVDQAAAANTDAAPEGGLGRTILVVEDEADLRETVCALLENGGYRVLAAADPFGARTLLASGAPIHALFTDVALRGGLSGIELARDARRMRQDLLVLLTSGYASEVLEAHGAAVEFDVVAKPYQAHDLLRVLGALLRGSLAPAETEALLAEVHERPRPPTGVAGRRATGTRTNTIRLGVMPFRALDPALQPDLSLGLAEEITTALSRFRWISCIGSASLAAVAGEPLGQSPRWRKLGLDFLLDGTFQYDHGRLRITVRLLDMRGSGDVIWAQRFDGDLTDFLTLQSQIAADTVAQVGPEGLLREGERAAARRLSSPTSYELMLRAIPAIYKLDEYGFRAAGALLEESLRLDPDNAAAHAWLAHWHIFLVGQGWAEDAAAATRHASHLAARAVTLDPGDARCLAIAGHIRGFLHKQAK
ncbi:MAG: ATP-binding protein, partial [Pseudomonadota bacterium]|nr:ATP-binding protein [Pseudomonadota bacterium]